MTTSYIAWLFYGRHLLIILHPLCGFSLALKATSCSSQPLYTTPLGRVRTWMQHHPLCTGHVFVRLLQPADLILPLIDSRGTTHHPTSGTLIGCLAHTGIVEGVSTFVYSLLLFFIMIVLFYKFIIFLVYYIGCQFQLVRLLFNFRVIIYLNGVINFGVISVQQLFNFFKDSSCRRIIGCHHIATWMLLRLSTKMRPRINQCSL